MSKLDLLKAEVLCEYIGILERRLKINHAEDAAKVLHDTIGEHHGYPEEEAIRIYDEVAQIMDEVIQGLY